MNMVSQLKRTTSASTIQTNDEFMYSIDMNTDFANESAHDLQSDTTPIQLQSDSFKEFVSISPSVFERWGLISILGLIIILIIISNFIPYPEKVQCVAKIHADESPKEIRSIISGKIFRLLKHNEEHVNMNDTLLLLESTAAHSDVQQVYTELKQAEQFLKEGNNSSLVNLFQEKHSQLGELQQAYQSFYQELLSYKDVIQQGYYEHKQSYIGNDIQQISLQHKTIETQHKLALQQLELAKNKFDRSEMLFNEKVISKQEFEQERIAYLSKKSELEQFHILKTNSQEQVSQKQLEILDIKHEMSVRSRNLYETLLTVLSAFEKWNQEHIILSPMNGSIQYSSFLEENQLLKSNETFAQIIPTHKSAYYAELKIPQPYMKNVSRNKRVLISFDGYDYTDYGYVEARITYISSLPIDSMYLGRAELNLTSSKPNHKKIPITHNMVGIGNIVISDETVLSRIVKGLWNKIHH